MVIESINKNFLSTKVARQLEVHYAFLASLFKPLSCEVPQDMVEEPQPKVEELDEVLISNPSVVHKERKKKDKRNPKHH